MSKITIMGAGGKMGCRIIDNLQKAAVQHEILAVEVSEVGQQNLSSRGLQAAEASAAVEGTDVLVLALPDRVLGEVAREYVPQLSPGAMVITLDPAAAHAGELPARADISYFVTHPCHPNVFDHFQSPAEREDFFGGVHARQAIVCALMQGPDEDYARGEALARIFFGPVTRSHRISVEHMAILEPTMAETCGIALIRALREVMEEAVERGVPRAAAEDFMFGHIKVVLGIAFGLAPFPFSDGAQLISGYGQNQLLKDDWQKLFDPESVKRQAKMIVAGQVDSQ